MHSNPLCANGVSYVRVSVFSDTNENSDHILIKTADIFLIFKLCQKPNRGLDNFQSRYEALGPK